MTKRVVVVGGAGFIGTALSQTLLRHGYSVCILDLPKRLAFAAPLPEGVGSRAFSFPDLTGAEQHLTGADALIHLACTTTPANSMQPLSRDAAENIAPSVELFELAGRAGVGQVLFASSGGTVYGNPRQIPVPEDQAGGALSGYGVSKLAIENYLALEAGQAGFTGVSLRIGNPYGTYQLRGTAIGVIARYLAEAHAGRPLEVWGDGRVVRDYIHIEDVARAVLAALETPDLPSGAYNIGSGTGYSVNEIIDTVFKVLGKRTDVSYTPARGFDVDEIILDTGKFTSATGWRPGVGLESGVTLMLSELV